MKLVITGWLAKYSMFTIPKSSQVIRFITNGFLCEDLIIVIMMTIDVSILSTQLVSGSVNPLLPKSRNSLYPAEDFTSNSHIYVHSTIKTVITINNITHEQVNYHGWYG